MDGIKVESVKLGDVLFYLDSKIELLDGLLKDDERKEVAERNKADRNIYLVEWYNGRVAKGSYAVDVLKELRTQIVNLNK